MRDNVPGQTKFSIRIYNREYTLSGGLDPDYISKLAIDVDEKMRLLAANAPPQDSEHLAVLAALNLADELAQLKENFPAQAAAADFVPRLTECNRLLEEALAEADTGPATPSTQHG